MDITLPELFEAMEAGKAAMTSQPSPADVKSLWDQALADGADQVIYIPMSSKLSASCEAAQVLAATASP